MILIPQYRTSRRAAAAPVTVNQEAEGSVSVVFGSAPTAGNLIVIVAVGGSAITTPSGFALYHSADRAGAAPYANVYTKTAGGGESATVATTGAFSAYGVCLSGGTLSHFDNEATSVASTSAGSSALNPPNGSFMIAGVGHSGIVTAPAADNGFTVKAADGTRGFVAARTYTTGASSQNCTLSWTTARNTSSILLLVSP